MKLASVIEHYQDALYARYGAQITPEQERALGALPYRTLWRNDTQLQHL